MEILRRKKLTKYNSVYGIKAQPKGWKHWMIFTQTIYSQIDTWQRRTKDVLNINQKASGFGLDDYQFWECSFTQVCCAKC